MVIGGLQKSSLSDFPGRISAIVFTRGCSFRCGWCHNPELVDPSRFAPPIPEGEVISFLAARRDQLQGVVVTGGEPTIHDDLPVFLEEVRGMGLARKLDTNGGRPEMLGTILAGGLADYLALDLKAPLGSYDRVAGSGMDGQHVAESLRLVIGSGVDHEVRVTYTDALLSNGDLAEMARAARGCARLALQSFRPLRTLDPGLQSIAPPSAAAMDAARRIFEAEGIAVVTR